MWLRRWLRLRRTSAAGGGECEAMEVEGAAGVESEDGSDEEVQDEEALLSRARLAYEQF